MFRKSKLAAVIVVAISVIGTLGSAKAHVGSRGGGLRIGGGLVPRARQGDAKGNRSGGNQGVARGTTAAPKVAAAPPVVKIGGTSSSSKSPVASLGNKTNNPSIGVIGNSSGIKSNAPESKVQSHSVQARVPANVQSVVVAQPKKPGDAATTEVEQNATDVSVAKIAPIEAASKEVSLRQIQVGATLTLICKDLSDKEGQVVLQIGEIALPATIKEWKNDSVVCTLPILGLTKASKATLHVLKADGKTVSTMDLELVTVLPASADGRPSSIDSASFGR